MARFGGPLPYKLRRIPGADVPKGPFSLWSVCGFGCVPANCRGASWSLTTLRPPDWARPDLELGSNACFDVRPCDAARLAYCRRTTHLFSDLFSPVSRDSIQFLQRRQPAQRSL